MKNIIKLFMLLLRLKNLLFGGSKKAIVHKIVWYIVILITILIFVILDLDIDLENFKSIIDLLEVGSAG